MHPIGKREVRVRYASLSAAMALPTSGMLDKGEAARMAALRLPGDRRRFAAGRALLRHELGENTGDVVAAEHWRFDIGAQGKPVIGAGLPAFEFNISHAGECVAVALSRTAPVGVDIEGLDRPAGAGIVSDVLTPAENARLAKLAGPMQWIAFLKIWTVKEACAKAMGLGVGLDFRALEVDAEAAAVRFGGGSAGFDIACDIVPVAGQQYCLATAALTARPGETVFRARDLGDKPVLLASAPMVSGARRLN